MVLNERVVVPTAMYGSETLLLSVQEKRKHEVFEMMSRINKQDEMKSEKLVNQRVARLQSECNKKVERNVLKWLERVERRREERVVKNVYQVSMKGNRGRGRP